ncbi:hypothetical protein D3OALGA1CA_193 [Olavius algarvensis associated proteobacterium Delta 3]|nr:hypothetical protein D3OALGA1CA_193 [Olavius algarvensis associated proteobacterium Delta 3]
MFLLRLDCAWNPAEASCPLVLSLSKGRAELFMNFVLLNEIHKNTSSPRPLRLE